jgi:cytochrome c oxidase assembly protein Cox11
MVKRNAAIASLIVGLLLSALAYLFYTNSHTYLSTTKQASGIVSEVQEFTLEGELSYKVYVTFDSETRKDVRFVFDIVKDKSAFTVGERIDLVYNPNVNETAVETSFFDLWGFAILFGSMGIFGVVAGLFLLFSRHSKQ